MLSALLGSFIRWALGLLAGWLVSQGVTCADVADIIPNCTVGNEQDAFTGALIGAAALGLSWWQKHKAQKKLQAAIEAPAGYASKDDALPWLKNPRRN